MNVSSSASASSSLTSSSSSVNEIQVAIAAAAVVTCVLIVLFMLVCVATDAARSCCQTIGLCASAVALGFLKVFGRCRPCAGGAVRKGYQILSWLERKPTSPPPDVEMHDLDQHPIGTFVVLGDEEPEEDLNFSPL